MSKRHNYDFLKRAPKVEMLPNQVHNLKRQNCDFLKHALKERDL